MRVEAIPCFVMTISQKRHEQTQPLIDYYKNQGILKSVDGTKPMDDVFTDIVAILGE